MRSEFRPSEDYSLKVNGKEVFVYQCPVGSYAILEGDGMLDFEIKAAFPYETVKVRPLSYGIDVKNDGQKVKFSYKAPARISVEFDDDLLKPLWLFVYNEEIDKPQIDDPKVRYYKGGQIYEEEMIVLNEGETLYLELGAILRANVFAKNADNIKICGRGIIDRGTWNRDRSKRERIMQFVECDNLTIKDVTIVEGPTWNVVPIACKDIKVDKVNIISVESTGDGFDLCGCENVHLSGCFARTNDDCVAIKAVAYDFDHGLKNIKNILVEDCVFWNAECDNAIEIGFETRCDEIRDITFRNIDIIHCEREGYQSGGTLTIHNGDRATISNVLYEDIRIEDSREKLIDFKILTARYTKDLEDGYIKNVRLKNIQIVDGPFPPSIIRGMEEEHMIDGVVIEDLYVHGEKITNPLDGKMVIELAKNIEIK